MKPSIVYPRSQGERFYGDNVLVAVSCATCHIAFAIPESLNESAKKHTGGRNVGGWSICCPMGHSWHYTAESEASKLERARDEAARLRARLDQSQASLVAQRGAAKRARNERDRLKKRAAAGVCPCCNRTFKQLARHMVGQHPDYEHSGAASDH